MLQRRAFSGADGVADGVAYHRRAPDIVWPRVGGVQEQDSNVFFTNGERKDLGGDVRPRAATPPGSS